MFTGIVSAVGTVTEAKQAGDLTLRIASPYDPAGIAIGASIACSGVCLTVVDKGRGEAGADADAGADSGWFAVQLSAETLARSVPGRWAEGQRLNLERAAKLGDELGGHIVTGHVDAVGEVIGADPVGGSVHLTLSAPPEMAPFIAAKGSVTIDGVSLTVNDVEDKPGGSAHFSINLIPHTAAVTTLGSLKAGDAVNIEIDVIARYLQRLASYRA